MGKTVNATAKEVNLDVLLRELKIIVNGHNLTLRQTLNGDEIDAQRRHNCFFIKKEEHSIPWLFMMCDETYEEILPSVTISLGDTVQISGQKITVKDKECEIILEVEERVGEND